MTKPLSLLIIFRETFYKPVVHNLKLTLNDLVCQNYEPIITEEGYLPTTLIIILFIDDPLHLMLCDVSVKITELWINMAPTSELTLETSHQLARVHLLLREMATNNLCPFIRN